MCKLALSHSWCFGARKIGENAFVVIYRKLLNWAPPPPPPFTGWHILGYLQKENSEQMIRLKWGDSHSLPLSPYGQPGRENTFYTFPYCSTCTLFLDWLKVGWPRSGFVFSSIKGQELCIFNKRTPETSAHRVQTSHLAHFKQTYAGDTCALHYNVLLYVLIRHRSMVCITVPLAMDLLL